MPLSFSSAWPTNRWPWIHGAPVGGEGRAGEGEPAAQRLDQRVRDRADIARLGAVEGRAVFLKKNCRQPAACSQRSAARLSRHRLATGAVRDFSATTTASASGSGVAARHADHLHGPHPRPHQRGGKVRRAGEVVCDATEDHASAASTNNRAWVGQSGRSCPARHAASAMAASQPVIEDHTAHRLG